MRIKTTLRIGSGILLVVAGLLVLSLVWAYQETVKANENESLAAEMQRMAYQRTELQDEYLFRRAERAREQWIAKTEQLKQRIDSAGQGFNRLSDKALLERIEREFSSNTLRFSELAEYQKNNGGAKDGHQEIGVNRLTSQILVSTYDLNQAIDKLRESAGKAADRAQRNAAMIVILFLILSVAISFGNSAFVNRTITRQIGELNAGARWFGAGNLDHRILLSGNDEFTALALSMNQMAEKLNQSYTSIANLQKEMDDRERAEEELRKTNQLFSLFMHHSPVYTYIKEVTPTESRVLHASENFRQMIGIPGSEMVGKSMTELFPPEFSAKLTGDDWAVVSKGDVLKLDEEFGGRAYNTIKFPILLGDKSLLAGYTIDITERKRMEEANQQNESRLRKLVDILQHPSESIQDFLDYALGQAIALTGSRIGYIYHYHEDRGEFVLNTWSREVMAECAVADPQTCYELEKTGIWGEAVRQRRPIVVNDYPAAHPLKKGYPKGHVPLFKFMTVPIFSGDRIVGVVGLANKESDYDETDILQTSLLMEAVWKVTDRKRAEEALRESEEKYRTIIENIEDGYHEVNLRGEFTFFNESTRRIIGYEREELLGMNSRQYADEENGRKVYQAYNLIYRTGQPVKNFEWQIIRKDGAPRDIEVSISLIRDSEGRPSGFRGIARDITDRKHAEEERRILQERLQRAEKMESLGLLAGGVAHDLNNVLGVVVGYSEMLLDGMEKSNPARRGLENVMKGGLRAAAIVEDLLTLARRGVQGRTILNLNKIVADCQQSPEYANLSGRHPSVQVIARLEPDLLNISGSSVHLGKTLYNLISNASEAMPQGGVVTIRTANRYLDKPLEGYDQIQVGDYVVLSISDTGEGISAGDQKRIFEPFYTKKIMGRSGTGLGLAVVWGTVKDHNGYINVQSEEGKGSTFALYFPVTREEIPSEAALMASEYLGKGEAILVVDDVKEQRDLAAGMLHNLNYNVATVSSGEEALAYIREHAVDLMVLDMIMDPGMDGLDTYRNIVAIRPEQRAIIVSGYSESDRVLAAQNLGAGAYVRKPYLKEKLGSAVRSELERERPAK